MKRSLLPALALLLAPTLGAAPFGADPRFFGNSAWFSFGPPLHGYYTATHHPELNPTGGLTIEFVIYALSLPYSGNCRSLVGKGYFSAYWVGICGSELRSYTRGGFSEQDGGTLTDSDYHHIAVTTDGVVRKHFIDGVEVASFAETGPPTTNTEDLRIGSDVDYPSGPQDTYIDEVRLWSYARSGGEIQEGIGKPKTLGEPGLVAVWNFDNYSLLDSIGGHNLEVGGDAEVLREGEFSPPDLTPWLTASTLPGFEVKARVKNGSGVFVDAAKITPCPEDTICLSGQVEDRPEIFVRVVGPKPNGHLWVILTKFTVFQVEVWIRKTGDLDGQRYYFLPAADSSEDDSLPGITHRTAFLP